MNDPQTNPVLEQLQSYIEMRFLVEFDDDNVTYETDLFNAGIIDSFGIVDIVSYMESTFDVSFTDNDMTSPLLANLGGMVQLINERRTTGE
jgi:D-alanine--poly(phosphoribitol) ligase subunit 2